MKISKWVSSFGVLGVALLAPQLVGCASDARTDESAVVQSAQAALSESPALIVSWGAFAFQVDATPAQFHTIASTHLAMFDALNAIGGKYQSFAYTGSAPDGASSDAAAIQAAYRVLSQFRPATSAVTQATLDARRDTDLAAIPDGQAKTDGIALGEAAAQAVIAARVDDDWSSLPASPPYAPNGEPDAYRPTPPAFGPPVLQRAGSFRPFAMQSSTQFQAPPPPAITSKQFAAEYEETRSLGKSDSTARTAEQTAIAKYFADTAPVASMRLGRQLASENLDQYTGARFLALVSVAVADSIIAVFTSKYTYARIRPVTLVADRDGPGTWLPLLVTPPHPEYPAAHASIDGAVTEVFERFFGHKYEFTFANGGVNGSTRTWSSFREFSETGNESRIWAGVHFRSAADSGSKQGRKVGQWVVTNILLPLEDEE